jgi:hypothetical protein
MFNFKLQERMSGKNFCLFIPLLFTLSSNTNGDLTGHLQPLGSQVPPVGDVLTLAKIPSPQEFFDQFVKPGKPVVFKGAATKTPAYELWTDDYLRYVSAYYILLCSIFHSVIHTVF